jgi:hypothetical protein
MITLCHMPIKPTQNQVKEVPHYVHENDVEDACDVNKNGAHAAAMVRFGENTVFPINGADDEVVYETPDSVQVPSIYESPHQDSFKNNVDADGYLLPISVRLPIQD